MMHRVVLQNSAGAGSRRDAEDVRVGLLTHRAALRPPPSGRRLGAARAPLVGYDSLIRS